MVSLPIFLLHSILQHRYDGLSDSHAACYTIQTKPVTVITYQPPYFQFIILAINYWDLFFSIEGIKREWSGNVLWKIFWCHTVFAEQKTLNPVIKSGYTEQCFFNIIIIAYITASQHHNSPSVSPCWSKRRLSGARIFLHLSPRNGHHCQTKMFFFISDPVS